LSALREIVAKFGIEFDDSALKKGHSSIESGIEALKGFGAAVAGAFAVKEIAEFVVGLGEEADALAKQSQALGMSLEELQQWNYAAKMSGVSADTLSASLARLTGGKYDAKSMAQLGVSVKEANGEMRSGPDLLQDIAGALGKIEDPTKRNTLAMGVLGKSYLQLMPLLAEGSDGLEALRADFEALGGGFTEEFAKQADEFGDNLDRMKTLWKGLTITVAGAVLPMLMRLGRYLVSVSKPLVAFLKQTNIVPVALLAAGLMTVTAKIGPLTKALKFLGGQTYKTILPLLLLEDFITFLAGGDSLFGRGIEKAFGPGTSDKVRAFTSDVKNETQGFWKDLWSDSSKFNDDMSLLWSSLCKDLGAGWSKFVAIWGDLWDVVTTAADIGWTEIKFWGLGVAAAISDAFDGMWLDVLSGARKALSFLPGTASAVASLDESIAGLGKKKAAGGDAKAIEDLHNKETQRIVSESAAKHAARVADYAAAEASRPGFAPIQTTTHVNVTVPPGTPAEVANRVAAAAASGVQKSNRATAAALVPGKG
jgi:hypothetical protein